MFKDQIRILNDRIRIFNGHIRMFKNPIRIFNSTSALYYIQCWKWCRVPGHKIYQICIRWGVGMFIFNALFLGFSRLNGNSIIMKIERG